MSDWWRNKIVSNARKEIEIYHKSNVWLENDLIFNDSLFIKNSDRFIKNLFLKIVGKQKYKQNQKIIDFNILVANLIYQKRKPISISLNRNNYKKTRYNICSYFIIDLVKKLAEKKYIKMKKGYYSNTEKRNTRISATKKLLDEFLLLKNEVIYQPKEFILLKDKKGNLIDYKETAKTLKIRKILKKANEVNNKAVITYDNLILKSTLTAIFIENFSLYGRLHTKGYKYISFQSLDSENRSKILINNELVTELDFSALHPHLLYASINIQYDKDPYSCICKNPIARPFLKIILLCMLNAKDKIEAQKGANNYLLNCEEIEQLKNIGITRAMPLMNKFEKEHYKIKKYFYSGKKNGLRCMNKDATICLDIVKHFSQKGIPILPIHDSFIIQSRYKEELRTIMQEKYKKHTGGFKCPIH